MKATELRIGNLLMPNRNKIEELSDIYRYSYPSDLSLPVTVNSIHSEKGNSDMINGGAFDWNDYGGCLLEYFDPIPLTEELLPRFGCKKESDNTYTEEFEFIYWGENRQFRITKNNDGHWSYWPEELFGFSVDLGFNPHVHKFQNLCFELTGEELELK